MRWWRCWRKNATIVISGAKIAEEIGVSRQSVWRWIETLRELGVKVKGHARTGYHVEQVPDILVPRMLSERLHGTAFAKHIYHYFKVGSTNTVAMQLGAQGEQHGAVVLAESQVAGRGRAGRTWLTEKSAGINCTILLRPEDFSGACSAADDCGWPRGARCGGGRAGRGSGYSLAERCAGERAEIFAAC